MGRRFRGWGGGSPSKLKKRGEQTCQRNGDGEKGLVCADMEKKKEVAVEALRKDLKERILGLTDNELDELLKAIEEGNLCSRQEVR